VTNVGKLVIFEESFGQPLVFLLLARRRRKQLIEEEENN
jgi:hypothetical protein